MHTLHFSCEKAGERGLIERNVYKTAQLVVAVYLILPEVRSYERYKKDECCVNQNTTGLIVTYRNMPRKTCQVLRHFLS